MNRITSPHNKIIREYRMLGKARYRKKSGLAVLEGSQLLREAVKAGIEFKAVLLTEAFQVAPGNEELLEQLADSSLYLLSENIFKSIAQTERPQGVGAIAQIPSFDFESLWQKDALFLLILDRIQDPGNLGTIFRTAAAATVDGIVLLTGTADPTNPKVLRAAMGGSFYLPVLHERELPDWPDLFKKREVRIIAADPDGDVSYHEVDYTGPTAVVIGNESRGASARLLESANVRAYIPLHGKIGALNAAVAAALFIFERERRIFKNPAI